jgi:hypothetical protein
MPSGHGHRWIQPCGAFQACTLAPGQGDRERSRRFARRTRSNIDLIMACPSGVFVIDAKTYKGTPHLQVEGGIIRERSENLLVGSRHVILRDDAETHARIQQSGCCDRHFSCRDSDLPTTQRLLGPNRVALEFGLARPSRAQHRSSRLVAAQTRQRISLEVSPPTSTGSAAFRAVVTKNHWRPGVRNGIVLRTPRLAPMCPVIVPLVKTISAAAAGSR